MNVSVVFTSFFIRFFDLILSFFGLIFFLPLFILISIFGFFDTGSPLFIQPRMGRGKRQFYIVKFRTMSKDTISVASHLANRSSITKFGAFLRRTKLDELPQLWNVLLGDMSLVGPRPNLCFQHELIYERDSLGIYDVRPGITGLAQVNDIDMSKPELLAKTDLLMIESMTIGRYFMYLIATVSGKGTGDRVK